jgi:hypothetical protein
MSGLLAVALATLGIGWLMDQKEPPPEGFTVICAWCKCVLRQGAPNQISHGMCQACYDETDEETP